MAVLAAVTTWILGTCAVLAADGPGAQLTWREPWAGRFAGREHQLHLDVRAAPGFRGTLAWEFTAQTAVVLRREVVVVVPEAGTTTVTLDLPAPEVKPGAVVSASVRVSLLGPERTAVATAVHELRLFHADAFASVKETLNQRAIAVFDPDGVLTKRLTGAGLKVRDMRTLDAIAQESAGLLIVNGSGASSRGLFDVLLAAAGRGVRVLLLPALEQTFPLPGTVGGEPPLPTALHLRQADVLREWDKNLDTGGWPPAGAGPLCGVRIDAARAGVVSETVPAGPGVWPWVEVVYPKGGRLLICAFPILETWEAGPQGRYLLCALMEKLSRTDNGPPAAPP